MRAPDGRHRRSRGRPARRMPRAAVAGLLLLVGWVAGRMLWATPASHAEEPAAVAADAAQHPAVDPAALVARRAEQRRLAHQLDWDRDPFTRSGGSSSGLVLSGILWDPRTPLAIINGQTLHAGQRIDDYQIVEIRQDRVIVTDGSTTTQLTIAP